jgi:hypothetical protein
MKALWIDMSLTEESKKKTRKENDCLHGLSFGKAAATWRIS